MRFLTHNIWWKLVSLVAAFGVWMNVASEPELSAVVSAPVEFRNYPADLDISSNNFVEVIDVEARGPSGLLRDLADSHLAAVIDLASVKGPGERTFTLTQRELNLPRGVQLIRAIPTQVRFNFEHRTVRPMKVQVRFSGTLPPGVTMVGYDVNPRELRIAGPLSRVNATRDVVSDPFDLGQAITAPVQSLAVYAADSQVRFLGPTRVTVSIHVKRTQ